MELSMDVLRNETDDLITAFHPVSYESAPQLHEYRRVYRHPLDTVKPVIDALGNSIWLGCDDIWTIAFGFIVEGWEAFALYRDLPKGGLTLENLHARTNVWREPPTKLAGLYKADPFVAHALGMVKGQYKILVPGMSTDLMMAAFANGWMAHETAIRG